MRHDADCLPDRMCATTPSPRTVEPPKGKAKGRKVWDELELTGSDAEAASPPKAAVGEMSGRDGEAVGSGGGGADAHDGPAPGRALLKSSLRFKLERPPMFIGTAASRDGPVGSKRQNAGGGEREPDKTGVVVESGDSWDGRSASPSGTGDAAEAAWFSGGRSTGGSASAGVLTQSRKWSARPLWRNAHKQDGGAGGEPSMDDSKGLDDKMSELGQRQKTGATQENVAQVTSRSDDPLSRRNRMKSALKGAATLLSSSLRPRQR